MLERKFALKYFRVLLNKRFAYTACFTVEGSPEVGIPDGKGIPTLGFPSRPESSFPGRLENHT